MPRYTCCLLLLSCLSTVALAADEKDGPVYTDPAMTDADYALQGEYRGYQRSQSSDRSSRSVGLQVIAQGNGTFSATKYYGGLPGEGWYGGERFLLQGERSGDLLRLSGDVYDIEILDGTGRILAKDGREAGFLQKIERVSPTMGARPPAGSVVLFDGSNTDHFKNAKMTADGLLLAGTETSHAYADFRLHAEFRIPYKPLARGQGRGNSGFYLQSRYEVQVLDSFGLEGVENECGSLYKLRRPDINMCLPPLQWQSYDIDFSPAKFDAEGNKVRDMQISIWHNGVRIHNSLKLPSKTGAGKPEGPEPLPTKLQDHGNPVVYRNIWLIDRTQPDPVGNAWLKLPPSGPPIPIR
ncbi:MAG: DUF1080 domain-containing protein [Planctomycetaceae bacterium]|nr:DUF1080 domain-containing protein [Planctomycetaceae bacterium]